ncbi:MAG: heavy-metal-associated domain-containing protein [Acidimicrobiales bacterium]
MTETTYAVVGMTCDHCVNAVTDELTQVPGVTSVHVDLPTGRVRVASERPPDDAAVRAAVRRAGYAVRS